MGRQELQIKKNWKKYQKAIVEKTKWMDRPHNMIVETDYRRERRREQPQGNSECWIPTLYYTW